MTRSEHLAQRKIAVFPDWKSLAEDYDKHGDFITIEEVVFGPKGEIILIYRVMVEEE